MQPKLQISAGVEYDLEPKSIYGDLYHLVATPYVKTEAKLMDFNDLTNPKSHNLIEQSEFIKILEGFKSL
jgi:hypothetical protein